MKILLIFTLCLISDGGASNEVTGYSGGGVLIKCKYQTEYTINSKYLCKSSRRGCFDQIKAVVKNQWINSGRFSLFDDNKSAELWVMIRDLTAHDTGLYYCGVDISLNTDIYTPVVLNVKNGPIVSREVIAYAKTRSNIKCKYEDKFTDKPKSFYKIDTVQWNFYKIRTEPKSLWSHDGRFSIHDNRSAGFFSVFIRELITEDTGTYACGVVVSDEIEIYTIVKLNVTEDLSFEKSISKIVHVGEDLTVSCKYPESHKNDNKFLCNRTATAACSYTLTVKESKKYVQKERYFLFDDREKQIFTVSLKNVTGQDFGEYWCGAEVNWKSDNGYKVYFTQLNLTVTGFPAFTLITVSVVLLLLLIGIIFFIVTLHKRRKMRGPKTTTPQASTQTNRDDENGPNMFPLQTAEHTNLPKSVYQRIDPNTNQSDSVYQSLNPNTNQSDSVYQSLNPNTNQSDSVYQSLNPNTLQSDSVYQIVNSNTNKSDSVIKLNSLFNQLKRSSTD